MQFQIIDSLECRYLIRRIKMLLSLSLHYFDQTYGNLEVTYSLPLVLKEEVLRFSLTITG